MDKSSFDKKFQQLTKRQEEVLQWLLSGKSDEAAAARFNITEGTYRKHIQKGGEKFGFKTKSGERSDKRSALIEVFLKYEPESVSSEAIAKYVESCSLNPVVVKTPPASEPAEVGNLNFVGRQGAIADLNTFISKGQRVILIFGEGGKGKSTLVREFCKTFDVVLRHDVGQETQNVTSIESKVEEWLRRYLNEETAQDFDVSLTRLLRKLQDSSQRIVIWIDNLEPALEQGIFIAAHRRYVNLLRGLTDAGVQTVTLITSREQIREPSIKGIELYELSELQPADWHEFYLSHGITTGVAPEIEMIAETSALYQMHNAYGGNAEAMSIFKGDICRECKGNLEAYWEKNKAELLRHPKLANLIESQFNKLQQDSEWEYRLLCRMGCFRFQDVPYVPEQGLLELLWDAPERQKARIIKALYDRCLIKHSSEGYYLHPVVRAEAISRLRSGEEWKLTNRKAAQFWTDSIKSVKTIADALIAFESYHHLLEIQDFNAAAGVITLIREERLAFGGECLGSAFYRLGLLQKMSFAINKVKNDVNNVSDLTRLNLVLGYIHNLMGNIHQAIECHQESARLAISYLNTASEELINEEFVTYKKLIRTYLCSFINIGLCKADLWEIEAAVEYLNEFVYLSKHHKFEIISANGYICLALLKSCLRSDEETYLLVEQAYSLLPEIAWDEEWSKGYSLLFLGMSYRNLGYLEKSTAMYQEAISYAEKSHYTQVKAKALNGLAEIYREKQDFEMALSHHSEAVSLLDKIGAKCDFADALFQRALTYQKTGEAEKSQADFSQAIRLFTEMNAPRQVERVQQAMNRTSTQA
jgi:tetratricopeptide (TPR) repeat protein/DNA-binding CsgD family transcriptional regulator